MFEERLKSLRQVFKWNFCFPETYKFYVCLVKKMLYGYIERFKVKEFMLFVELKYKV